MVEIEFEATFANINKETIREQLSAAGAILIHPEFLMLRSVFALPSGHDMTGAWLRVRKEFDRTTMSLKIVDGNQIDNQKELCLTIDDYDKGVDFLKSIGCDHKAFQESRRELWRLKGTEVTLDEWPYLEPFIEIEGPSEEIVKNAAIALGFDYSHALFCSVDYLYNQKYGIPIQLINNEMPLISFSKPNPFIN